MVATSKNYKKINLLEVWTKLMQKHGFIMIDFDAVYLSKPEVATHIFTSNYHKKGKISGKGKIIKKLIAEQLRTFSMAIKRLVLTTHFQVVIVTRLDEKSANHILNSLMIPNVTLIVENGNLSKTIVKGAEISQSWAKII